MVFTMTFISAIVADASSPMSKEKGASLEAGDPVVMSIGKYTFSKKLMDLGGVLPLTAEMIYYSKEQGVDNDNGMYFNFYSFIEPLGNVLLGHLQQTPQFDFDKTSGVWKLSSLSRASRNYVLKESDTFFYFLDPVDEKVFVFEKYNFGEWFGVTTAYGRLKYVFDRNGNRLTYTYEGAEDRMPIGIYENDGGPDCRKIRIQGSNNRLLSVTERLTMNGQEQDGRSVALEYGKTCGSATQDLLCSLTDAEGKITRFTWNGSETVISETVINSMTHPNGNTPYTMEHGFLLQFDGFSDTLVVSQTDAYNNKTTFTYDEWDNKVTETRPDGTTVQYRHWNRYETPSDLKDPAGKTASFGQSEPNRLAYVIDRLGDKTAFTYHAETGKIASVKNAEGHTVAYTYTPQDQTFTNPANNEEMTFTFYNLTQTAYPDGTTEQFIYDPKGNVIERTDRAGKKWTYTYNDKGQVTEIANPSGGKITFTYNNDGTLASGKDSDTGITTYQYDIYKRPVKITHPDGAFIQMTYDLNDRITSVTDENNHTYTYGYDGNGNRISVTDPDHKETKYAYDLMDRVVKITDRLEKDVSLAYDNIGQLASVTDPNGLQVQFRYDPRGWANEMTLGGQTWKTGYDDEGVVSAHTTPLNHATQFETDKLGYTTKITDPMTHSASWARDSMNRVTAFTDPLARVTAYTYDNRDFLTGVTLPGSPAAVYTRNDLGLAEEIADLNGNKWKFTYTPMGRLVSETDPMGNTWQYAYNERGRLKKITYPGGETQTRTYDPSGNLKQAAYSGGPTLDFTFSALDQVLTASGVSLTRDPEGRVTGTENPGTVFGATYDNGGRLGTVSYNNDTFTVTYTYDAVTGLLKRVEDNLIHSWMEFAYDIDRNLNEITRSNGVKTTFTRDDSGRITRIQDGGFTDIKYMLDASGNIIQADLTAPLNPADFLAASVEAFAYDEAHRVKTTGFDYDQRGRLKTSPGRTYTWIGDSRLTGINSAVLTYNGLGDVITRADGGTTVHYYYNYALPGNPVVAERDDVSGNFLRWYVWSPSGSLFYMIDAAEGNKVYFYHFDRTGSALALTDSAGNVSDSYAYSPYGRLLKHQGASSQPFTFVGQWGVRQESADGNLYQMGARYYDAQTARFISREPLWPDLNTPLRINPYLYADLNPLKYVDPEGKDPKKSVEIDGYSYDLSNKSLKALLNQLVNRQGETYDLDEVSDKSDRLVQAWIEANVNQSNLSLKELFNTRFVSAGPTLSEDEEESIQNKAFEDYKKWHPGEFPDKTWSELMEEAKKISPEEEARNRLRLKETGKKADEMVKKFQRQIRQRNREIKDLEEIQRRYGHLGKREIAKKLQLYYKNKNKK